MTPEQLLRLYFRAKDENRPHLLIDVFAGDAVLEINNRSSQISFPAVTVGLEAIEDVLVRQFNATYENIYSFYLDRPLPATQSFACNWLVGMTEKASRNVRMGCGSYAWTFRRGPALQVTKLEITIEQMIALAPAFTTDAMQALGKLDYPWSSAAQVGRVLTQKELGPLLADIGRG